MFVNSLPQRVKKSPTLNFYFYPNPNTPSGKLIFVFICRFWPISRVFLKQRRSLCYIWEMGGCPLPLPHPFSSLFLTSKIIFLQKQRLSNWCSLLWMVLTLVLVTHLPVPVGFSSGRFFVYFKAEILILRRSFFSLRWVCLSLWARFETIRAQYKPPGKINISPFTFLLF